MKNTLVGSTGFVGGNLAKKHPFNGLYHTPDIAQAFGKENGLVVYCGMPSEKFLANADPAADLARAKTAMENIRQMKPEKLVLVSTVDVYPLPLMVNEDSAAGGEGTSAYGQNRFALETWVRAEYPDALILRLPGLFGQGLKKNFIYDMFVRTPSTLTREKYEALAQKQPLVKTSYVQDAAGFYRLQPLGKEDAAALRAFYETNDFNALSFTDSRAEFQFYDLSRLWDDIKRCLKKDLRLVNLGTEPVEAGELYCLLFGTNFVNKLEKDPPRYDMRTRFGRELGGMDYYVADRDEVVAGIAKFARETFAF